MKYVFQTNPVSWGNQADEYFSSWDTLPEVNHFMRKAIEAVKFLIHILLRYLFNPTP